jgi:hypothetical protein
MEIFLTARSNSDTIEIGHIEELIPLLSGYNNTNNFMCYPASGYIEYPDNSQFWVVYGLVWTGEDIMV